MGRMSKPHTFVNEFKPEYLRPSSPTKGLINLVKRKGVEKCVEIGVFEGQTSNAIADNLPENGKLICIDPLLDCYLSENLNERNIKDNNGRWGYFDGQYNRFINNTKQHMESGKIELVRKLSSEAFNELTHYHNQIDFCFIDGDHRSEAVYKDGVGCFELCKPGGYILFDDYTWGTADDPHTTRKGIDRFLLEYRDKCMVISKGAQVLVSKV